ncbi:MAG: glutamate--cysteine ligase [Gammaproteobacteria bacterium]|nr:glutamate--cysteine ligase [Gammaproteobacteria bacterium]
MLKNIEKQVNDLASRNLEHHLGQLQRGLEKESLRVDTDGLLAQTPHPSKLGSALTHPTITTDYSEALLEFVTGVHSDSDALLSELYDIHHYTYRHLGNEKLWVNSMPCIVEGEQKIPIARFGSSNVAKMKEAYRRGLGHRYGRLMQSIAGIHFNFSLPDAFWNDYFDIDSDTERQDLQSDAYFGLIRNFHRLSWLGCYLFGASPAVCKSFLGGREHMLSDFDQHSFYAPNATSLRLSDLGYSNNAQSSINICYHGVQDFSKSLHQAIQTPHPEYAKFGTNVGGKYQQLNANILQIENEFYSVIRPKRVTQSGESPSQALSKRGVQYVEVRSLDLNPFEPTGIDKSCIHFFDTLMLYCLLNNSKQLDNNEWGTTALNRNRVVMNGRDPDLTLQLDNTEQPFKTVANQILDHMEPVAALLDSASGKNDYALSLKQQKEKIKDTSLTPSARIIAQMESQDISFFRFAMNMAEEHGAHFKQCSPTEDKLQLFRHQAQLSHEQQAEIERNDTMNFDEFLNDYFARQNGPL